MMGALIDIEIGADGASDTVDGDQLSWATESLATPIEITGFGSMTAAVALGGQGLPVAVPPSWSDVDTMTVELVAGWDALAAPALLLGGNCSITLRLLPSAPDTELEATITCAAGVRVLRTIMPTATTPVALALVVGGTDAVLLVDGAVADRRPLGRAGRLMARTDLDPVLVGAAPDGTDGFVGSLLALRFSDRIPATHVAAAQRAAVDGIGEIDTFVDDEGAWFGQPLSEERRVGSARWREYEQGTITWTPATGVHTVRDPFREAYATKGGPLGALGLPTSESISLTAYLDLVDSRRRTPGGGLRLKDVLVREGLQGATVIDVEDLHGALADVSSQLVATAATETWTDAIVRVSPLPTAFERIASEVMVGHSALGAAVPMGPVVPTVPIDFEALQPHDATVTEIGVLGNLHVSPHLDPTIFGPAVVHPTPNPAPAPAPAPAPPVTVFGAASAFVRNDALSASLGAWAENRERPLSRIADAELVGELIATADRTGADARLVGIDDLGWVFRGPQAQRFERGVMVQSVDVGVVTLSGEVLAHWLRHGASDGFLGVPLASDVAIGAGRMAAFAGGHVYASASSGVHEVHGAILERYLALGGPTGQLGFPTSDEEDVDGAALARRTSFEAGDLYWSPSTGVSWLRGAIREAFLKAGGAETYGIPVTDEVARVNDGAEVRFTTFAGGQILAWTPTVGVFDHMVLDMASVRSGEIDDEISSDDQPELFVTHKIWVDGVQVAVGRTPSQGFGSTNFALDGIAPVDVPLHAGASVRIEVQAWDEDTGPDDHFATHDVTYTLEDQWFGWLGAGFGSHADARSTWNSSDANPDTFKVGYTLAPPFDGHARFDRFRQEMAWSFENRGGPENLSWQECADTFEDVADSSGSLALDDVLHPGDRLFYVNAYRGVCRNGNCMGMTLTAANTYLGRTGLGQPLTLRPESDGLWATIHRAQGIQTGDASMLYKSFVKVVPGMLDPRNVFQRVSASVARRIPILVNMRGKDGDGERVGHSCLAYRVDESRWPRTIWLADPNHPAALSPSDDVSRIEIDADGSFRMYDNGTVSTMFGAGAYSGTLGESFLYDFPVAVLQGPHYTPNWLLVAGLELLGAIMSIDGAADVTQVSGGGRNLFGDQRSMLQTRLIGDRSRIGEAAALGLLQAAHVEAANVEVAPAGALSFDVADLVATHVNRLASTEGGLAAVASIGAPILTSIQSSWTDKIGAGLDPVFAGLDRSISAIDPHLDIGAIVAQQERLFTPGAWPQMAFVELEEAERGELFTHRGPLPGDLRFDLIGRGGAFRQTTSTGQAAAMVSGELADRAIDAVHVDNLSSLRPGVRISTSEAAKTVAVSLSVVVDEGAHRWVGWDTELTVGSNVPTAGLTRSDSALGVELASAPGSAVALRCGERRRDTVGTRTTWVVTDGAHGGWVAAEPADPASPFGALRVRRTSFAGDLLAQTVVDPSI